MKYCKLGLYTTLLLFIMTVGYCAVQKNQVSTELGNRVSTEVSRGSVDRAAEMEKALLKQAEREERAAQRVKVTERVATPNTYKLKVQVTAYTPFEPGQTSGTGLAADGKPAVPYKTMAVDPDVIPFYSRVFVPGLGWFIAHDTGSAIVGNIVDVCLETSNEANNWGRRVLEVTVIPPS